MMFVLAICVHFAITLVLSLITKQNRNSAAEKILLVLVVLSYCLLVAIRPDMNVPDVDAYRSRYYEAFHSTSMEEILSIGILKKSNAYFMNLIPSLLAYVFSSAGVSFEVYSFVVTLVECAVVMASIIGVLKSWGYEYNLFHIFLLLMAFYGYYYQMIAFAQGISTMCIFLAFFLWVRRRRVLSLIPAVLALFSHSTGLAVFPIIGVYALTKRLNRKTYNILWFVFTFLLITGIGFVFSRYVEGITKSVIGVASEYYSEYAQYEGVETAGRASFIGMLTFLLSKFVFSADTDRAEYWKLVNVFLVYMLLSVFFASWDVISRLADVFFVFLIFLAGISIYERSFSLYSPDGTRYKINNGETLTFAVLGAIRTLSFVYILLNYTRLHA